MDIVMLLLGWSLIGAIKWIVLALIVKSVVQTKQLPDMTQYMKGVGNDA